MGLLTENVRALNAALPFPSGADRRFVGWGDNYIGGSTTFRLPDERDYSELVGKGSGTSLIAAAVNWMARNIIPARPILFFSDGEESVPRAIRRHPVVELLRNPTRDSLRAPGGYYSGTQSNMAGAASWITDGNVYRLKVRSTVGRVVQRWYVPHTCMEPIGADGKFIAYYRYRVGSEVYKIDPRDVDHLRFGLDPENPRKGLSPIRALLRELYTDEEAARFTAAILHNVGFPGAVVVPGQGVEIGEEGKEIKEKFDTRFGGDERGRTIVLSKNAEVKFLQWTPQELDLSAMRDVPEERVTASLGIPASVIGFGTGLQGVKVGATLMESRAMALEDALLTFLEAMAESDTASLLPEFIDAGELPRYELGWDTSRIASLSKTQLARAELEATLVRARIKRVDESRATLGLPPVGGADGGFQASPGVGGSAPSSSASEGEEDDDLSARETSVIELVAKGLANKEIAGRLRISERQVERHLASARERLGLGSRAELIAWATREGEAS